MSLCPKRGFVILETEYRDLVVPTTCKTWSCSVCRNKIRQLTALKMMYGPLSAGGPSHFITTTYRNRLGDPIRTAAVAGTEWSELWRQLKARDAWKEAAWLKVPELTKRGQVHLHGIVVKAHGTPSCRRPKERRKRWMQRPCSVSCLAHDLARTWYGITGDSFVVDCQQVRSTAGIAGYVAKYMSKSFEGGRKAIEALGFRRRWSSSYNWPRCEPLHLRGTDEGWLSVTRVHGSKSWYYDDSELSHSARIRMSELAESQQEEKLRDLEQIGGSYLLAMRALAKQRKDLTSVMRGFGIELEVAA